jgi:hypothetical protein
LSRRALPLTGGRRKLTRIDPVELAAEARAFLKTFSDRGVFEGFSEGASTPEQLRFTLVWHHNKRFELLVDLKNRTVIMPMVLPNVPSRSVLDRNFRSFVKACSSDQKLPHRRIDPAKIAMSCVNRRGALGVRFTLLDDDIDYALQRLLHLVQETYVLFLLEGIYLDYCIEQFGPPPGFT